MPNRAKTLRPRGAPTRQEVRQSADARRREAKPWRALYVTAQWQAIRMQQLAIEPLCRMCCDEGRVTPARVCDHVEPHRGDAVKFFAGPFQSLCDFHHNRHKQREESGVGAV